MDTAPVPRGRIRFVSCLQPGSYFRPSLGAFFVPPAAEFVDGTSVEYLVIESTGTNQTTE